MQVQVQVIEPAYWKYNVYPWGPVEYGLYKQVLFIYRWSLEQVGLKQYP